MVVQRAKKIENKYKLKESPSGSGLISKLLACLWQVVPNDHYFDLNLLIHEADGLCRWFGWQRDIRVENGHRHKGCCVSTEASGLGIGTELNRSEDNQVFTRLFIHPTWYLRAEAHDKRYAMLDHHVPTIHQRKCDKLLSGQLDGWGYGLPCPICTSTRFSFGYRCIAPVPVVLGTGPLALKVFGLGMG